MGIKEEWKEGILNALFPRRCILCDEILEEEKDLCPMCKEKEVFMEEPCCKQCGRGILREEESLCGNCKRHSFSFSGGMILYPLTEEIEEAITAVKYRGRQDKAAFFGRRAGERFSERIKNLGISAIIPVPIHKDRRRKRGYNQSELIGKALEKQIGIPMYTEFLKRTKKTKALKDCSPAERLQNLFSVMECDPLPKELKTVLLLDDIFTTGATMEACTRTLLESGAEEVYILAVAARAER